MHRYNAIMSIAQAPTGTSRDTLLDPMPRRKLGSTGWEASLLTIGGVKWDVLVSEGEAIELLHRAIELGVNTFDTAANYGRGASETRLGKALEGRRDRVWINTKTTCRDYDGAKAELERSLERLRTDVIDLYFMHQVGGREDLARACDPDGVLKVIDEYKRAGHIRFAGVSGHHHKEHMLRMIEAADLDAVLLPAGVFNEAYNYSYVREVVPAARRSGMAVLGMKVFAAGRVKHVASIEPYLRFSIHQDIDTAVIGCDSIAQLEQTVRIVKAMPEALTVEDVEALKPEALEVTRPEKWDAHEFNWVEFYKKLAAQGGRDR